mgnify:FL=1
MPSAVTKIATGTPSSTNMSTFATIPGTYDDLMLIGSSKGDSSSATLNRLYIRINNDGGNNYGHAYWGGESASTWYAAQPTWDSIYVYGSADSQSSNTGWGHFYMYFTGYTDSAYKAIQVVGGYSDASNSSGWTGQAMWLDNSAITELDIGSSTGDYISGTTFTLYGISYS